MYIFNFFSDIKIEIDNLDSFIKKSEQKFKLIWNQFQGMFSINMAESLE